MTQVILFDVDGVLIHGYHAREELRQCWDENIEKDLGVNREGFCALFAMPLWHDIVTGRKDLFAGLSEYLPHCDYHDDPQIVIDYWLKKDSNINHDLIEKIKIIKQSPEIDLYIATNQEHNRAKYLMNFLGFAEHFKDIFYSAKIGHIKPTQDYFRRVHSLLDNPKTPPIFFDDTPAVVQGAEDFGWQAYEFQTVDDLYQNDFVASLLK